MSYAEVLKCGKEIEALNLTLKKNSIIAYELLKIIILTKELQDGFKLEKFHKTTKKGTKITLIPIKTIEEYEKCSEDIKQRLEEFKKEYKLNDAMRRKIDDEIK